MSATTQGAGCGAALGVVLPLLLQELGLLSLSDLAPTLEWLVGGLIVGLVVGAAVGRALGRPHRARPPPTPE